MTATDTATPTPAAPGGLVLPASLDWPAIRARLADAMTKKDLGLRALGRAAGMTHPPISKFLSHKSKELDLDSLAKLAAALDMPVAELAGLPAPAPARGNGMGLWLRHDQLHPGKHNPRKEFDRGDLEALAQSIKGRGAVLQPLAVGPKPDRDGRHAIVIGERRWRAVGLLIAAGDWPKGRALPCVEREAFDPAEILADAVVENAQRVDLPPLDEARALHCLVHEFHWTTAALAEAIGKTQRHIQLRLDLIDKLAPKVQQALGEETINLATARALTVAEPKRQLSALAEVIGRAWGYQDAGQIKRSLLKDLVPVGRNIFKLEDWSGEIVEDPDDPEKKYFRDRALFVALQRKAAEAKRKALEAEGYDWVKFFDGTQNENPMLWQYETDKRRKKGAGAIIDLMIDLSVEVHRGLYKPGQADIEEVTGTGSGAAPARADKPAPPKITQAHMILARARKTWALQNAVAKNPKIALRLAVLGLMGAGDVRIHCRQREHNDAGRGDWFDALAKSYAASFPRDSLGDALSVTSYDHKAAVKALETLTAMSDTDVSKILALLVAGQVGSWSGYEPALGDKPLPLAISHAVDLDMAGHAGLDEDYLKSCNKAQLVQIVDDLTIGRDAKPGTLTMTNLRSLILATLKQGVIGKDYVPRSLRFGAPAEIEKLMPKAAG